MGAVKYPRMTRKVLHFHLPKTGGTALRHFFVDQLGDANVSPPLAGMKLRDALQRWSDHTAISGHFAVMQGDVLPSDRYSVTVLRDPINRFLSDLFFKKYDNTNRLIETSVQSTDLDSYLEHCSAKQADGLRVQLAMLFPLGVAPAANISLEEKLHAAKHAIDLFDAVGVQEELEDFAGMLCAEFQWGQKPLGRVNMTSRRISSDALTANQRRAMLNILEPEIELYHHALTRFKLDRRRYIYATPRQSDSLAVDAQLETAVSLKQQPCEAPKANGHSLDFGDRRCELISVEVRGAISGTSLALAGERMSITVRFVAHEPVETLNIGIAIKDERGVIIYGTNSQLQGHNFTLTAPGEYEATFSLLNRLGCGYYDVDAALVPAMSHFDGCYHWREQMSRFEVPGLAVTHFEGRVMMDASVSLDGLSEDATWTAQAVVPEGVSVGSLGRVNPNLTDFNAIVVPMAKFDTATAAHDALLPARVRNNGSSIWPTSGRNPVKLSYRWLTTEGGIEIADGIRTALPTDLSPSEEAVVAMHVHTPSRPGFYSLVVSLVQEQNAWFVDQDANSGFSLPVEIKA
jgi:hypothetical protein